MRPLAFLLVLPFMALTAAQVPPSTPEEPKRPEFDLSAAHHAAAKAALDWQDRHDCVTCHTNGLFLVAGAKSADLEKPYQQSRSFAKIYLDRYLQEGRAQRGQHGAIEGIVATSAFLAIGESRAQGLVTPETLDALRHALSRMSTEGHYPNWLRCDWPPYEVDHHFGVTLMLIAIGTTPGAFTEQPEIASGIARLRTWLEKNPPQNAHHTGMILWADATGGIELSEETRAQYINVCRELQQDDGGWSVYGIGKWKRPDGSAQITQSEAYATAFMLFVLQRCGLTPEEETVQRGRAWLQANQRESGRWFSRSPRRDRMHYLSNAATNFSIMALEDVKHRATPTP